MSNHSHPKSVSNRFAHYVWAITLTRKDNVFILKSRILSYGLWKLCFFSHLSLEYIFNSMDLKRLLVLFCHSIGKLLLISSYLTDFNFRSWCFIVVVNLVCGNETTYLCCVYGTLYGIMVDGGISPFSHVCSLKSIDIWQI